MYVVCSGTGHLFFGESSIRASEHHQLSNRSDELLFDDWLRQIKFGRSALEADYVRRKLL
jgi:hypothetical protein